MIPDMSNPTDYHSPELVRDGRPGQHVVYVGSLAEFRGQEFVIYDDTEVYTCTCPNRGDDPKVPLPLCDHVPWRGYVLRPLNWTPGDKMLTCRWSSVRLATLFSSAEYVDMGECVDEGDDE